MSQSLCIKTNVLFLWENFSDFPFTPVPHTIHTGWIGSKPEAGVLRAELIPENEPVRKNNIKLYLMGLAFKIHSICFDNF